RQQDEPCWGVSCFLFRGGLEQPPVRGLGPPLRRTDHRSPASVPGVTSCADTTVGHQGPGAALMLVLRVLSKVCRRRGWWLCSALALLVAQVLADHHDPTVTADHLALVADLLDARLNLHLPAVFRSRA